MALSGSDRRVVRLTGGDRLKPRRVQVGGALVLPSLQLSGEISPLVEVGGALSLGALALSGGVTPEVEVTGELLLPSLHLSGGVSPRVEVGGSLELPNLALSGEITPWTPAQVPEVAAGMWWDPAVHSNHGQTSFVMPNLSGITTFDQIQTTVAAQPSLLSEEGHTQFHFPSLGSGNGAYMRSSGVVQRGWSGASYIGLWVRFPDGQTTSGLNVFFYHRGSGTNRGIYFHKTSATVRLELSADGVTTTTTIWAAWTNPDWHWVEGIFDPSETGEERAQYYLDHVKQPISISSSPAASLFATNTFLSAFFGGQQANVDATDKGPQYFANGRPSVSNRLKLSQYKAPRAL